ncbi:MAG: CPBP family intramembrane metalloprotease [Bacteroidales bacterium]|nr:CPBP family intramembrane metalloprotease [Bacteroidales bacterium]
MSEIFENNLVFSIAVFFSTIGFVIYHFFNEGQRERLINGSVKQINLQRLSGVFLFGIAPAMLLVILNSGDEISIATGTITKKLFVPFGILSLILVPVNFINAKTKGNLLMYPQIRTEHWNLSLLILSALSWIAYLFAYEFLFRGLLLSSSLNIMGIWPAIILNIGIYSLVHIPKGAKEAFWSILLGFIICLLVVRTGSFWIAFFIHVVLALSNEWFSLRSHPEIQFKMSK